MFENDMYSLVENVVGNVLVLWGLAIVINKNLIKSYVDFVLDAQRSKVLTSLIATMFFILGLSTIHVHNDWYWGNVGIIVTLVGWIITIKAGLWLLFPKVLTKVARKMSGLILNKMFNYIYGVLCLVLGLLVVSKYYLN